MLNVFDTRSPYPTQAKRINQLPLGTRVQYMSSPSSAHLLSYIWSITGRNLSRPTGSFSLKNTASMYDAGMTNNVHRPTTTGVSDTRGARQAWLRSAPRCYRKILYAR